MSFRLHSPVLLGALPVIYAFLVWVMRRSYVRMARPRQRASFAFRVLLVTALTFAAAQPELALHTATPPVVALVDVSDSVPDSALASEQAWLAAAWKETGGRGLELVTFAGQIGRAHV